MIETAPLIAGGYKTADKRNYGYFFITTSNIKNKKY